MSSTAGKSLVVIVALAVFATIALTAVNLLLDRDDVRTYAFGEPVARIVVTSDTGDVRLIRAGARVEVRENRHYVANKPILDHEVIGGVLRLDSHCRGFVLDCSADLRVTVPAGIEVAAQSDSGNVHADGIDVRNARLSSDSGDVDIDGLSRNDRAQRSIDAQTD